MNMNEIIDRITRDVVNTLNARETAVPCSTSGATLLIVDEPLSSSQWQKLTLSLGRVELYLFNLSSAPVPSTIVVRENLYSAENVLARSSCFKSVAYVAAKMYQLSAIANLDDCERGLELFFKLASSTCKPTVINLVENSYFANKISSLLNEISSAGISIDCTAAAPSAAPRGSGCDRDRGECSGCGHCTSLIPDKVDKVIQAGAQRVSSAPGNKHFNTKLASMIDHTLLKPDATKDAIIKLCSEAREYSFASVCVNPGNVKLASDCLKGSPVKVCTVIGFPLGATTSVTKALETRDAIANGASEIDMVINVGALKAGNYELVQQDIEAVVQAAAGNIVKVIIETGLLTDEEKVMACKLSKQAGADFVKTSTGFGHGGATAKDVALMRQTVGKYMGVKASGGIRDLATANAMVEAGASRIGASASVAIVKA